MSGRPTPGPGLLAFDRGLPDSFGRYHDLIAETGAASARVGDVFEATVAARNASGVMLFDRQVAGVEHRREAAHIRRDGFEHFYLQVLRSGLLMAGAPGDERWLAAGDAVLMDATRPQRTVVVAADYVTIVLPRPVVEAAVADPRRLHGRLIPRGASRGLGDAALSLARSAAGLDDEGVAAAGGTIADMLGEVAGRPAAGGDARTSASDRLRVGLFIDAHIGRPRLDVGAVAAGVGMSRSALYRAFAPVGGVEREIGRRRIARFRAALLRSGEGRPLEHLATAFGFSSPSHCSRLFKDTYGLTPRACRDALHGLRGAGAALRADHVRNWYGEIGAGARR